jgi:hypothetical protein
MGGVICFGLWLVAAILFLHLCFKYFPSEDTEKYNPSASIPKETSSPPIVTKIKPAVQKRKSIIKYQIDLSGKRNVTEEKMVCLFIEQFGLEKIEEAKSKDQEVKFVITGTRNTVKQIHHTKYSVPYTVLTAEVGYDELMAIHNSDISRQHERNKLNSRMRLLVKQRDNYTCQNCGKRMLDGVGLQIDHIIPIAKGGKTELSNLQVLCSVCNRRKSDKIVPEVKKVQQTSEQDFQAYMQETREYIKSFQQKKKEDE